MKAYNSNTLVNISNSILKHFGVDTFHDTIPEFDDALKGHKKIVVCLFDGMGQNITRKHLKEDSFIRSHYFKTVNSVFPPTTAAATTSLLTGKFPIETGWLAWDTYFPELNRNIILFKNTDYNTGEKLDKPYSYLKYPLTYITDLIHVKNNSIKTGLIQRYPIQEKGPKSLRGSLKQIKKFLKQTDDAFLYFYWDSPDREMHRYGIDRKKISRKVRSVNSFMEKVSKQNQDTLFILLADHGHVNTKYLDISKHSDLYSLIDKPMCLEKRASSIFVKKGKEQEFAEIFNKYYGNCFDLLTRKEVLDMELFGKGKPCKGVLESFGDFIAISNGEYSLYSSTEYKKLELYPGHHGGGTEDERLIDVSIYNK